MGKERKKSGFTKVVTPVPRTGGGRNSTAFG